MGKQVLSRIAIFQLPAHPHLIDATKMNQVPTIVKSVQSMDISVEEITYLIEEMALRHQEQPLGNVDFYTAVAILAERYRDSHDHLRSFCVIERVFCFLELLKDDRMRGWTTKGIEEGSLLTDEAVFHAVAKCPMKADAKRLWFDADEFFSIALSETEPAGSA